MFEGKYQAQKLIKEVNQLSVQAIASYKSKFTSTFINVFIIFKEKFQLLNLNIYSCFSIQYHIMFYIETATTHCQRYYTDTVIYIIISTRAPDKKE